MFSYTEKDVNIPVRHPLAFQNEMSPDLPGLAATLVEPSETSIESVTAGTLTVNRQNRIVVLCHGQDGHRNYVYQKVLAQELAQAHGLFVIRFDFRGYGYSQDVESEHGQTTQIEIADLQIVMEYVTLVLKLLPAAIVGHSRAAVAMFSWALSQQSKSDGMFVPNLVNCSGRYNCDDIMREMYLNKDSLPNGIPYSSPRRRFGKIVDTVVPLQELVSLAGYDMDPVKYLRTDTSVLTIHGDRDIIVNVRDSYIYAEKLNQVKNRHTHVVINGADHNYMLDDSKSPFNLTPNDGRPPNAVQYMVGLISRFLAVEAENARFHKLHEIMPGSDKKRFKTVQSVINFRDYGGFPVAAKNPANGKRLWVKQDILFRSAKLDWANEKTTQAVSELGIKQVFDMRSAVELKPNLNTPNGLVRVPGAVTTHQPVFSRESYSPEAIVERMSQSGSTPSTGLEKTYLEILTHGARNDTFRPMFLWLRDHPDAGMLIHCSAGKDRTGIFAALVLLTLGVDVDTVAHEYELTTAGYGPERSKILSAAKAGNISGTSEPQYQGLTVDGWETLLSSRYEVMIRVVAIIDQNFGGVGKYLSDYVGLLGSDVEQIRGNLLYDGEAVSVNRTWKPSQQQNSKPLLEEPLLGPSQMEPKL